MTKASGDPINYNLIKHDIASPIAVLKMSLHQIERFSNLLDQVSDDLSQNHLSHQQALELLSEKAQGIIEAGELVGQAVGRLNKILSQYQLR